MKNKKVKLKISPKRFFCPKNRRGQFYLIAAIVIISIIIGFTSISNYSKDVNSETINNLRDELHIETGQIVEYGVNQYPTGKLENINYLLNETSEVYVKTTPIKEMYFILADMSTPRVAVSAWLDPFPENLTIDGNLISSFNKEFSENYKVIYYTPTSNSTAININDIPYEFELKPGVNIYFVISGGDYVATNKDK